ncbi:MAG: hypothetical protein C0498_08965 [Anaerolinea sp.]|nr:hypothetical protein [Anaerolinea sp.]
MVAPTRALRLVAAAVFAATALGLGQVGVPSPARAATPDLTLVTATTYQVLPDEGRVAVTVRITATNRLRDTATRRFYFDEGYLAVLPGTSNFRLSAATGSPSVSVRSRKASGVILRLQFGSRLASGKSMDLTLTFDLLDPGGAPERPVRISPSLVAFRAWASASAATPGSSVEVRLPAGYTVVLGGGPLVGPATDVAGWQVFTSGPLDAPLTFVVDISAARPGGYVDSRRSVTVGDRTMAIILRAWPDDPAWRVRVGDLVLRGLPVLAEAIGAPWPFEEPLTIAETFVRSTGGYAGIFDPVKVLVQVGYTASPGVILHEAAHGWFNGGLVADRWIAEAFASYYAEQAAATLGVTIDSPELANVPVEAALPLNAWGPTGEAAAVADEYGYAASLALAREIAALVGDGALRDTWRAAAAGEPAYQPASPSMDVGRARESGAAPPDWRALLDLLEARADPEAAAALDGLWRRWVIRPEDAGLLAARADARRAYAAAVEAAAPWALPRSIRDAMRAWQFDAALRLIDDAEAVLRQRAVIAEVAAASGLTPPDALRPAFEGDVGLAAAAAEAAVELASIGQIRAAQAARIANPGLVDRLGLIGVDPEARLAAARAAFEDGDQDAALAEAGAALAAWRAVPEVARGRIISGTLLVVVVLILAWLVARRGRAQRVSRIGGA